MRSLRRLVAVAAPGGTDTREIRLLLWSSYFVKIINKYTVGSEPVSRKLHVFICLCIDPPGLGLWTPPGEDAQD